MPKAMLHSRSPSKVPVCLDRDGVFHFRPWFVVLWVCLACSAIPAAEQKPQDSPCATYRDATYEFRVSLPSLTPFEPGKLSVLVMQGPKVNGYGPMISIGVRTAESPAAWLAKAVSGIEKGGGKVVRQELRTISGTEAGMFEAELRPGSGQIAVRSLTLALFRKDFSYHVICSAVADDFAKFRQTFVDCVDSFRFRQTADRQLPAGAWYVDFGHQLEMKTPAFPRGDKGSQNARVIWGPIGDPSLFVLIKDGRDPTHEAAAEFVTNMRLRGWTTDDGKDLRAAGRTGSFWKHTLRTVDDQTVALKSFLFDEDATIMVNAAYPLSKANESGEELEACVKSVTFDPK